MGGLVSAEERQNSQGRIDGTLTTCGLVAGALSLNNYQLDGEYALNELLAPSQQIQLVRYATADQAATAAAALAAVAGSAQSTAQGRARIALAAALLGEPTWFSGAAPPAPTDYAAQEQQQADELSNFVLPFIVSARYQIELAAGGNSSFTKGVNYAQELRRSSFRPEVQALYRTAGLSLSRDLATLTRSADITADPGAIASLARTSMVTGRLSVPELDIHTIYDSSSRSSRRTGTASASPWRTPRPPRPASAPSTRTVRSTHPRWSTREADGAHTPGRRTAPPSNVLLLLDEYRPRCRTWTRGHSRT
jgi:hypothetical protein